MGCAMPNRASDTQFRGNAPTENTSDGTNSAVTKMRQFLRVPRRVHNAVMLMTDLAERSRAGDFVSLNEVADRNNMSRGFLEEIAVLLKGADLIEAKRGAHGGYRLSREPDEISVGDVVTAVEGPLALVKCLGSSSCAIAGSCASQVVWSRMQGHIEDSLAAISLADVMSGE